MKSLQPVRDYLRWWRDPRATLLGGVLAGAEENSRKREQAALHFIDEAKSLPISPEPAQNWAVLQLMLGAAPDVVMREFTLGTGKLPAMLLFTDNMAKRTEVTAMLDSMMVRLRDEQFPTGAEPLEQYLKERSITGADVTPVKNLSDVTTKLLTGDVVLMAKGLQVAFRMPATGFEHRTPEEPAAEPVVRGPKEGFVETGAVNIALVRRRLHDPRLRVESFTIGKRSNTPVTMVYLAGVAWPEMVDEVRRRLKRINIDGVIESGYIEELIEDAPGSPFPLVKSTERPDVVAGELLEGRVAIITDGTPHALVVPTTFTSGMQASEDYYQKWPMASFTRMLRYLFLVVALLGPASFIAVTTYHQEMLPTQLLLSIMSAREGVPFPAMVEALMMEIAFEALREAGVRLPKPVGQAVSIVGALVIGEAAVQAGLVSPILVIVVAVTGIASFVIPMFPLALALRLLRFPMIILAGSFGFYGITLGLIAISIHLASLRSFGVPYMAPTMPATPTDFKDLFIRVPWWALVNRPKFMPVMNRKRQEPERNKPAPPDEQ
ncbi:MAG: gerKA1 [Firmicutes bacterium]|nr:gerKA1 [Bacillota bacterium]